MRFVMKAIRHIGWLALLAGAFAQPKSDATITVNLDDGASVKGIVKVVARVQSEKLVERVEFQVDGALREVDDSTPYEYEWDTVTDTEGERRLKIVAFLEGNKTVSKELRLVIDNGVGIAPENLTRIFAHGFTTRPDGHGFGLHSSANAAAEMGGSITARSDGPGTGATFIFEFPVASRGAGQVGDATEDRTPRLEAA